MKSADRKHAEFLRRNSGMLAGILEAALPKRPLGRLPFLDELTILVAVHQVSGLLDARSLAGWRRLLDRNPPDARALWSADDWSRAVHGRKGIRAEAPHQLHALYRQFASRSDFPSVQRCRNWGQPRWRSLFRRIGVDPNLAGTVTALILDRSELPGGPLTSQLHWRLGYSKRRPGRPSGPDVAPKDVDSLKWRFQSLAASSCTPQTEPGSAACMKCPLRSFCRAFRQTQLRKEPQGLGFVDLFAGPGGISLGLTRAGFQMVCAVDRDRHSADTLYLNHNNSHESAILCRD